MERKTQKGAALIEFAVVVPLLLLLFAGVVEVGLLVYNQQILTNASREGARAGITWNTGAEGIVLNYCKVEGDTSSPTKWKLLNLVTLNTTPPIVSLSVPDAFQDDFEVTVQYNYRVFFTTILGFNNIITLKASTRMKMEQETGP